MMNMVKLLHNTSIIIIALLCFAAGPAPVVKSKAQDQAQDPVAQAEAMLALSHRQNYVDHAMALQTAQEALKLWQALADNQGIARAYAMIGRCHLAQSNLPEAIQNYENALHIWQDQSNIQEQAEILIMLGFIEDRRGEWANSISFFNQALNLIGDTDAPIERGQIASGFADIFNQNGLPANALVQYRQALDYYRKTPYPVYEATTIWAIGSTYYLLKNYPEAITHLQQALASLDPKNSDIGLCNEYLGRVYQATGELPTALQHFQSALDIFVRANNPREAARVLSLIGQINQQQGNTVLARQHYQQSLKTFRRLSDHINEASIDYALGSLELQQNNLKLAEDYLQQSIEITENLRRIPTSRDLTAAFTASVYDRYEKYIECLMLKHEADPAQGFAVRAFETSELARGRSLAELLRATETNLVPGLDPKLAEQEKSLRLLLRVKEDYRVTLLSRAYKKEELAALDAELMKLREEYKQISENITARYPAYGQITRPAGWDLRQIQDQVIIDDDTLLLEYSLGSDKSYVWAVTRDTIRSYKLASPGRINEAAQKAYKLLLAPPGPDIEKYLTPVLQELSQMVLSPLATELNKHRIIIVADGALHYIPFQMLPIPPTNHEPLVARYEIVNAPSASILGELRKAAQQRQPAKLLAAFGDPVFESNVAQRQDGTGIGPSAILPALETAPLQHALRDIELNGDTFDPSALQPLFYAKQELDNLRKAALGGDTFVASGFDATREQLLSTDLTQYAILHFATHGLLDTKQPEYSGLVLSTVNSQKQAQNGFIGLQDIYGLKAPVDLVVLSACRTALGKDVRGEGLLGLTRGFMYAGASSVVASLWKVNDEATAELMRQFYVNMLQKQMTPAAALREAQNSIRQRTNWQSPYYWAGFTLQGEYHQVIHPASAASVSKKYPNIIIGAALMLLLGVALWYCYSRVKMSRAGI
jgi:CHAT domain-containing protein/tetratricopeptide (TPR) repeat protein